MPIWVVLAAPVEDAEAALADEEEESEESEESDDPLELPEPSASQHC